MSTQMRKYEKKARAASQEETRARIAKAAAELHATVGPSATTVTEIAKRAGVSRLTVYNHFPDDATLYPACAAHWTTEHPIPDFTEGLEIEDVRERAVTILTTVYAEVYRGWGAMMFNLQRDRAADEALDQMMAGASDLLIDYLADSIGEGRATRRAVARLALDFWTWHRLDREGLGDDAAAALMADAVAGA